jgi:hypothetical protein
MPIRTVSSTPAGRRIAAFSSAIASTISRPARGRALGLVLTGAASRNRRSRRRPYAWRRNHRTPATISATARWYAPTTSRRSSESSRADNAVEPTRSHNITVKCRRWASACAWAFAGCRSRSEGRHRSAKCGDGFKKLAAVASKHHAEIFESSAVSFGSASQSISLLRKAGTLALRAQAPQPRRYVHTVILDPEERQAPHGRRYPSALRATSCSAEPGEVSGSWLSGSK